MDKPVIVFQHIQEKSNKVSHRRPQEIVPWNSRRTIDLSKHSEMIRFNSHRDVLKYPNFGLDIVVPVKYQVSLTKHYLKFKTLCNLVRVTFTHSTIVQHCNYEVLLDGALALG